MARRTFTPEFKTSAARLVRDQGDSVAQAAQNLGVDPRSIREWVARVAAPPAEAPVNGDAGLRQELERLRAGDKRLLMEREILPLNVSVARRSISSDSVPKLVFRSCFGLITRREGACDPQGVFFAASSTDAKALRATFGLGPRRGGGTWTASANDSTSASARARRSPADHSLGPSTRARYPWGRSPHRQAGQSYPRTVLVPTFQPL
jgi:transposase